MLLFGLEGTQGICGSVSLGARRTISAPKKLLHLVLRFVKGLRAPGRSRRVCGCWGARMAARTLAGTWL